MHLSYFLCSVFFAIIHIVIFFSNIIAWYIIFSYIMIIHCLSDTYLDIKKMIRTITAAVHALLYAKITPKYD